VEDAASIPGVVEIVDQMSVKRSPADVKAAIEDRLFWDAAVQRDRVQVAVSPDGIATLSGKLDSWSEVRAAVRRRDVGRGHARRQPAAAEEPRDALSTDAIPRPERDAAP
jgi:hypothetical protein